MMVSTPGKGCGPCGGCPGRGGTGELKEDLSTQESNYISIIQSELVAVSGASERRERAPYASSGCCGAVLVRRDVSLGGGPRLHSGVVAHPFPG